MAATEIAIIVNGGSEHIEVQDFIGALESNVEILRDLDAALSMKRRGTLRWVLGALSYGSPAIVTLHAIPTSEEGDYGPEVTKSYLDGLEQLREGKTLPPGFSDDALDAVKKLARLCTGGIKAIQIRHGRRSVDITERVAVNIDELIGERYESTGSIEGTVEMVTVHDQRYFRIYDAVHRWGVPCYFRPELLETVRFGLDKRIIATGRIRSDRAGKPQSMHVEAIDLLMDVEKLPKPSDIRGLAKSMTGGKPAEDYLRELRDNYGGDQ